MKACQWESCFVCELRLSLQQIVSFKDVAIRQGKVRFDSHIQSSNSNKKSWKEKKKKREREREIPPPKVERVFCVCWVFFVGGGLVWFLIIFFHDSASSEYVLTLLNSVSVQE